MLRHLLLDPEIVLEVLQLMGCIPGPASENLRAVTSPEDPGLTTVLDLTGPIDSETIEAHLQNLELSASDFLDCFSRFKAPFTN